MKNVVCTIAIFLLLSACSSNKPADVSQQQIDSNQKVKNTVETYPQQPRSPVIPLDGRLRDEHIKMYVSVKIKQEQIRYQHEESDTAILSKINTASIDNTTGNQLANQSNSYTAGKAILNERLAIEEFEFNVQLYHWVKQTIQRTHARSLEEDIRKYKRFSNFEEYVLVHNLNMLEKHEDELRFADNYKIPPASSLKQYTANIVSGVAKQQMLPLILKPSS
jgi:hypothetical protein